jgi:hypothetical protein
VLPPLLIAVVIRFLSNDNFTVQLGNAHIAICNCRQRLLVPGSPSSECAPVIVQPQIQWLSVDPTFKRMVIPKFKSLAHGHALWRGTGSR